MEQEPINAFKQRVSKGLREGALIVSVLLCLYTLLALISYDDSDPGWTQAVSVDVVKNYTGVAGAWLADIMLTFCWLHRFSFAHHVGLLRMVAIA